MMRKPRAPKTQKSTPTAASRIPGQAWSNKLGFIKGHMEQEVASPTDIQALFEYIDLLHTYLDKTMDDATAGTGGWRQYALGEGK
jgi:hypothetical protein